MTVYYVRRSGSDAAAGTSAATAWATIGKALGVAGIASGDTVYIGAGTYREAVTVNLTPVATTSIIGDVDGAKTGDAGEVRWTSQANDFAGGTSSVALSLNSKNYLAFRNLCILGSNTAAPVTNIVGHDVSFTDCAFMSWGTISPALLADVASNLTFDRCHFYGLPRTAAGGLAVTLPTSATADYDANVQITNCMFVVGGTAVAVTASGAGAFKGGGVRVRASSMIGAVSVSTGSANVSSTFPVTVYDCYLSSSGTTLNANVAGQIIEDYNFLTAISTVRTNVTAGLHSIGSVMQNHYVYFGQERIWGGQPRPFGTPLRDSPVYGWGAQAGGPTVDILNRPRPAGANRVVFTGTATAGAATTLTDSGATWGTSQLSSAVCKITGGTGSGQTKIIKSHTGTVLTVHGNWKTTPDNTSTYSIYFGAPSETFTCTSGSTTTAVQSSAVWTTNMWAGFTLEVTAGTGSGQTTTITSNNNTTLTVPTLATGLDNTSQCAIYRQTSINAVLQAAGCLERHDSAEKETGTTDAGSVGLVLTGWADHAIYIPVDATSTTLSVRARYDAAHAATNKPQAVLDANGEIGVTTETKTMTVAAGNWETLTFAAQTPSAKGWVTVRLLSRSDLPYGKAFFDTLVAA